MLFYRRCFLDFNFLCGLVVEMMPSVPPSATRGPTLPSARRSFYELPDSIHRSLPHPVGIAIPGSTDTPTDLFSYINENIIGKDKVFSGPYGLRNGELT